MVNLDTLLGILFGAGGIFSVTGFIKYRDWSKNSKLRLEENHLTRLENENKRAAQDAANLENENRDLRKRLNQALDDVAMYRGRLIQAGLLEVKPNDTSQ